MSQRKPTEIAFHPPHASASQFSHHQQASASQFSHPPQASASQFSHHQLNHAVQPDSKLQSTTPHQTCFSPRHLIRRVCHRRGDPRVWVPMQDCASHSANSIQVNSIYISPKQSHFPEALYRAQGRKPPQSRHNGDRGKEKLPVNQEENL